MAPALPAARRPAALVVHCREHEQFARNELVLALLRQLVGDVEQFAERIRNMQLAAGALDLRQLVELFGQLRAEQVDVNPGMRKQRAHRAALLVEQRRHQVHRLDELVIAPDRQRLRIGQRFLEFTG